MKVDRATIEQIRHVALHMRERDFAEMTAVAQADTREELADILVKRFGGDPDVLCGESADGEPICIGGLILLRPNVASMFFYATDKFPVIGLSITRFIRNELIPRYHQAGVHRIEAVSLADYPDVHQWLETLGMQQETEPLRGYGKRGEAFVLFSKVQYVDPLGA